MIAYDMIKLKNNNKREVKGRKKVKKKKKTQESRKNTPIGANH